MRIRTAILAGMALVVAAPVFAQGQGRGFRGGFGRGGGGQMSLLMMEEVQKELKVDAAQLDLIKQIGAEEQAKRRQQFQGFRDLSREEQQQRFQQLQQQAETDRMAQEKKIAEVLEPAQVGRLKQLDLQRTGIRALERKDVAASLKLTADQQAKIKAAIDGEREGMRAAFQGFRGNNGQRPSDEQLAEARKKMQDLRTGTDAKINAVLTDPQKKQWQGMLGAPFKFPENQRGFGRRNNNA